MAETENAPSNASPREGSFNAPGWELYNALKEPFHLVSKKNSCMFRLESAKLCPSRPCARSSKRSSRRSSTPSSLEFFAVNLHGTPADETTIICKLLEETFDNTTECVLLRKDRENNGELLFALGFGNIE